MSDYIPNPPNPNRDPRNDYERLYEEQNSGKGLTLVVGILVAIAVAAGLMFFTGPRDRSADVAQQPAQMDRTLNVPADQPRAPAIPARPAPPAAPTTTPANPQQ
jgi:hypothetical protein